MTEIFSDSTRRNCPKTQAELTARLKSVENCINNNENLQQVNIEFCKRAFRLLADCGLITEETVRFLSDAEACRTYDPNLKFPYNSGEGVLRKTELDEDVRDGKGIQRFYHGNKMHVLCGGTKYLIANNWFADPIKGGGLPANKRAFYQWLKLQTLRLYQEQ